MSDGPSYFVLDEIEWPDERGAPTAPLELVEEAERLGARRKFLARGEGGFHSQYSEFPPGYAVPLHSHDHDELILLLDGSCTMSDGQVLGRHDSVVLQRRRRVRLHRRRRRHGLRDDPRRPIRAPPSPDVRRPTLGAVGRRSRRESAVITSRSRWMASSSRCTSSGERPASNRSRSAA